VTAAHEPVRVVQSFAEWLPLTQTWLFGQLRHLPPALVESHVVCERTSNLDQFPLPNIHDLLSRGRVEWLWDVGLRRLGVRRHLGLLVRVGRRARARVVHSHFGHVGWGDAGGAQRLGAAHVVTFYGHDLSLPEREPEWGARYRQMFASASLVLAEGSHMAGRIAQLGCPTHKLRVHHLGVRVGDIRYAPRRWSPGEPLRVLIAASFREKKGIPYALEAIARLRRELPVEVTVIGDAGPQPAFAAEKARILRTIAEHRLDGCVRLLGYQSHATVFDHAYRHHVFLSPSVTARDGDTEGGAPVTIAEMAATGMPIVSSRHCDIPEVVRDGVTGLLAAERDVDGLVARLRWLVTNPDAWRPMLDAARRHVEAEYDAERQGSRLAALYLDAAHDAPVPHGHG
jgi:colanic acid/amylovoran biosynthesis glycosyltransferase